MAVAPLGLSAVELYTRKAEYTRYHMLREGGVYNATGDFVCGIEVASFVVTNYLRNPETHALEAIPLSFDISTFVTADARVHTVEVVDLNVEGADFSGRKLQLIKELLIEIDGSTIRAYVPQFPLREKSELTSSAIALSPPLFYYDDAHDDVLNFYNQIRGHTLLDAVFLEEEEEALKSSTIPNLLVARDQLMKIYHASNPKGRSVIKMTGKPGPDQTPFLFFPGADEELNYYCSVKIFPNGVISFDLSANKEQGMEKKRSCKVFSHVDTPTVFKGMAKLSPAKENRDASTLEDIQDEFDLVRSFNHPNIASPLMVVYEETDASHPSIPSAYYSLSNNMLDYLDNAFPFHIGSCETPSEYFHLMDQLLNVLIGCSKALQYLHEDKDVIHQDIKPSNILIEETFDEEGRLILTGKLTDFGLCVERELIDDDDDAYKGTEDYYIEGATVTDQKDLYGFGHTIDSFLIILQELIEDSPLSEDFTEEQKRKLYLISEALFERLQNLAVELQEMSEDGQSYDTPLTASHLIVGLNEVKAFWAASFAEAFPPA